MLSRIRLLHQWFERRFSYGPLQAAGVEELYWRLLREVEVLEPALSTARAALAARHAAVATLHASLAV